MTVVARRKKVKISDLNVGVYQRKPVKSLRRKIAENFDPAAFGTPFVGVRPDGTQWIVDGYQRSGALTLMGEEYMVAEVHESPGQEWEASMYDKLNSDRKQQTVIEKFRGKFYAKQPAAVEIVEVSQSLGFDVEMNATHTLRWGKLQCISALQEIHKLGGADLLGRTLGAIYDAWEGDDDAMRSYMIVAVGRIFHKNPDLDYSRFVKKLGAKSARKVMQASDALGLPGAGGSRAQATARAICQIYNQRLAESRRISVG